MAPSNVAGNPFLAVTNAQAGPSRTKAEKRRGKSGLVGPFRPMFLVFLIYSCAAKNARWRANKKAREAAAAEEVADEGKFLRLPSPRLAV